MKFISVVVAVLFFFFCLLNTMTNDKRKFGSEKVKSFIMYFSFCNASRSDEVKLKRAKICRPSGCRSLNGGTWTKRAGISVRQSEK